MRAKEKPDILAGSDILVFLMAGWTFGRAGDGECNAIDDGALSSRRMCVAVVGSSSCKFGKLVSKEIFSLTCAMSLSAPAHPGGVNMLARTSSIFPYGLSQVYGALQMRQAKVFKAYDILDEVVAAVGELALCRLQSRFERDLPCLPSGDFGLNSTEQITDSLLDVGWQPGL